MKLFELLFWCFLLQFEHLDNDENGASDAELGDKIVNLSLEKCNASFYLSLLTARLESEWQKLHLI